MADNSKHNSLCFEKAKELSFVDQFILPTADIEFDEKAQDSIDPFGAIDKSDDWMSPPDIIPAQFNSLPTGGIDRRAGIIVLPKKNNSKEPLGQIDWPEKKYLYGIHNEFPKTKHPFNFLDDCQIRNAFEISNVDLKLEGNRWLNLADVADQIG